MPCTFLPFKANSILQIFFRRNLLFRQVLRASVFLMSKCLTFVYLFSDMVKHELRVMSYELRLTSYELRVESLQARVDSLKVRVKIQKCEFKSTSYEFKSTSYEFKSTSYEFKSTSSSKQLSNFYYKLKNKKWCYQFRVTKEF